MNALDRVLSIFDRFTVRTLSPDDLDALALRTWDQLSRRIDETDDAFRERCRAEFAGNGARSTRTASERRAAGEAEFCSCYGCVANAPNDLFRALRPLELAQFCWYSVHGENGASALLRAIVIATLLDPATWARPAGWRP